MASIEGDYGILLADRMVLGVLAGLYGPAELAPRVALIRTAPILISLWESPGVNPVWIMLYALWRPDAAASRWGWSTG
jgi:hypothetical protein